MKQGAAKESLETGAKLTEAELRLVETKVNASQQLSSAVEKHAAQSQGKMNQGISTIKNASVQLEQTRNELLQAIQAQGQATQMMVMEILAAIRAPRVRVPVRGQDGRIAKVIDQVQDAADTIQ